MYPHTTYLLTVKHEIHHKPKRLLQLTFYFFLFKIHTPQLYCLPGLILAVFNVKEFKFTQQSQIILPKMANVVHNAPEKDNLNS